MATNRHRNIGSVVAFRALFCFRPNASVEGARFMRHDNATNDKQLGVGVLGRRRFTIMVRCRAFFGFIHS